MARYNAFLLFVSLLLLTAAHGKCPKGPDLENETKNETFCSKNGTCVGGKCFCEDGFMLDESLTSEGCIKNPSGFAVYKSLCLIGVLLLGGKFLRMVLPFLQSTFMPVAIIAGLTFFVVLQGMYQVDPVLHKAFTHEYTAGWNKIGPFAVDVLFASLFLGTKIPGCSDIINKAGPQFLYNQLLNWGLWTVSALIVGLVCAPFFGSDPLLMTLVPAGFTGGHAIVYALAERFEDAGYDDAVGVGLYIATLGQVFSFILGVWWINMAAAKTPSLTPARPSQTDETDAAKNKLFRQGLFPDDEMPSAGKLTVSPDSMDVLTLHAGIVLLAMFIGVTIWQNATGWMKANLGFTIERFVWCMGVGIVFQMIYERLVACKAIPNVIDPAIMSRIQGILLDFLIVSAMSTLDVQKVLPKLPAATLASAVGLAWLGYCTWWLAFKFLPDHHFERAICEYGQTTGVISSGLILLKMCDPEGKLPVMESFALKNFAAMPLLFTWLPLTIPIAKQTTPIPGIWIILLISSVVLALVFAVWYFVYKPKYQANTRLSMAVEMSADDIDQIKTRRAATERYSRGSIAFA